MLVDQLSADKLRIVTLLVNQFLVLAHLHDLALLHDHNDVGILNGRESVRNHDDGLITGLHQVVKSLLHLELTFSVES